MILSVPVNLGTSSANDLFLPYLEQRALRIVECIACLNEIILVIDCKLVRGWLIFND